METLSERTTREWREGGELRHPSLAAATDAEDGISCGLRHPSLAAAEGCVETATGCVETAAAGDGCVPGATARKRTVSATLRMLFVPVIPPPAVTDRDWQKQLAAEFKVSQKTVAAAVAMQTYTPLANMIRRRYNELYVLPYAEAFNNYLRMERIFL